MRRNLVRGLASLDALAVENPAKPGTADINFSEGWIELKWMRRWPVNAWERPVLINHFTPQQRVFLMRRWAVGQSSWLLLQVGREWLLFNGQFAAEHVGMVTRGALLDECDARWGNGLVYKELIRKLT